MSVMVTIKTEMTNADIAHKAFMRRFKDVKVSGNTLTASVTTPERAYGVRVEVDLTSFQIRCDSDHKNSILPVIDEAYRAEEIIQAAEDEGKSWTETRNEEKELVLEVEGY